LPEEFCDLEFSEQWLVEVQNTAKFWLGTSSDLAVFTSGSSGAPKEIKLAKNVLFNSAKATLNAFDLKAKNSALLFLPCQYIGGKMMVFRAMAGGLSLHLVVPKLSLPDLGQNLDFVPLTPLQASSSLPQLNKFKKILLGGGPVHASLLQELQELKAGVFHSYGMTETASHVALRNLNGADANELFSAVSDVTFSVDKRNCLVIHAPKLNAQNLVTNDVVELRDNTHFLWKGRADNVINSGGVKLFPEEIEKQLELQIDAPFFIGSVPDDLLGQKLVLFVETESSRKFDFSQLAKLQQPKKVFYLSKFMYTATDKIDRKKTQKLVQNI
jgi:O-succinylbenzoic acid--CoA ligase